MPDRLRSKISFSRTRNIPNLISCIYTVALVTLHWLCVYMVCAFAFALKQTFVQCEIFSEGTLAIPPIFSISSHFVLWEAESQTKYCCSPKITIFGPHKILGLLRHWWSIANETLFQEFFQNLQRFCGVHKCECERSCSPSQVPMFGTKSFQAI